MRILISAYGGVPGKGSEPGAGWNWFYYVASEHDVWVLSPESERAALLSGPLPPERLKFVFYDLPSWIPFRRAATVPFHIRYHCWQIAAYFVARRLHMKFKFDVVHHLVLGTHWKPSFLALLPIPFVWGPVGGAESAPPSFLRVFPLKDRLYEHIRHFVRFLSEMDPFVQLTARRSSLALAKSRETAVRLQQMGARNVELCSEAGLTPNELEEFSCLPVRSCPPFRVVSCGRMLHWKGFEFGLRAFAMLAKSPV